MVGGQAGEQLAAGVAGSTRSCRGGEGRVAEVHEAQVGPALGERRRQEAEVVVLHQHGRALGGRLGHHVGEGLVHRAVGAPTPRASGCRSGAGGPGRRGRGGRTRGPRCRRRRRRPGRRRRRRRAAAPGSPRPRPRPRAAASRSPSDMAAATHRASVPAPAGPGPTPARRRPAGHQVAVVVPARTTPGPGWRRSRPGARAMGPLYTGRAMAPRARIGRCFTVAVRVVIAPDKFQGTATARAVARADRRPAWEPATRPTSCRWPTAARAPSTRSAAPTAPPRSPGRSGDPVEAAWRLRRGSR